LTFAVRRSSSSLFDQEAGSVLVPTKTFPFLTEYDKDDRAAKLLTETAPASSNNFVKRRRPSSSSSADTLFDSQDGTGDGKTSEGGDDDAASSKEQQLPSRNFDIITFGGHTAQKTHDIVVGDKGEILIHGIK
jgi:hypothetical protein